MLRSTFCSVFPHSTLLFTFPSLEHLSCHPIFFSSSAEDINQVGSGYIHSAKASYCFREPLFIRGGGNGQLVSPTKREGRKESSLRLKKLLSPYYLRAIIQFWFAFSARAHCARFSFPFASVPSCFGEFHSGFWSHPRKISKTYENMEHTYTLIGQYILSI